MTRGVCWDCGTCFRSGCPRTDRHGEYDCDDPDERTRAERAERFARLWKRMAKTLMDRSWYQHGKKHGAAEERARIVAVVRGMMCKDDVGDCDLCIAYQAVITVIEANP